MTHTGNIPWKIFKPVFLQNLREFQFIHLSFWLNDRYQLCENTLLGERVKKCHKVQKDDWLNITSTIFIKFDYFVFSIVWIIFTRSYFDSLFLCTRNREEINQYNKYQSELILLIQKGERRSCWDFSNKRRGFIFLVGSGHGARLSFIYI